MAKTLDYSSAGVTAGIVKAAHAVLYTLAASLLTAATAYAARFNIDPAHFDLESKKGIAVAVLYLAFLLASIFTKSWLTTHSADSPENLPATDLGTAAADPSPSGL